MERKENELYQATDPDTDDPEYSSVSYPTANPVRGVRRKWYVVLGSILHSVAVFTLAGISALHPRALPPRDALVVVALCLYLVFRRVVSIGTSVLSFLAVGTGATPPLSISSCMTLLGDVKSSIYYPPGVSFYPVTTFNT
ncbi:hypothetical protein PsorP6_004235 [Peronosclerospora sorghi]|uniref:Uncharacterized protein n=1 Tax=Peronosclerospora sorghi TaxID=230839 RepID=A0ACC0VRF4_9STRA|nr:hypothetical protein PsorP6_004235 [Peronosclerospora sorghi]